ncbi:MAG: thiamine pyrophosphate-dependent enzyme [Woeseiaceae bacterium]|nr:thiamine pyrophosphate-dependent enzyme [Woeseiaceae bacterium]
MELERRQAWALSRSSRKRKGLPDWGTDITNPDFTALAEACGALGISVTDPGDLDAALQQAFDAHRPVVVNVSVDPDALIMPPKIELSQAMKFGMAKIREAFGA